jgi:hypothetical protein
MRTFRLRFFPTPHSPRRACRRRPCAPPLPFLFWGFPQSALHRTKWCFYHALHCILAFAWGLRPACPRLHCWLGWTGGHARTPGGAGGTELAVAGKVNAAARLGVGWVAEVRSGPAVYQRDGAIGVARDERGATVWGLRCVCASCSDVGCCCLLLHTHRPALTVVNMCFVSRLEWILHVSILGFFARYILIQKKW